MDEKICKFNKQISSSPYHLHFTDVVVSLGTAIDMPVIFVAAPEDTTVIISFLMVHRLASIPVKLVASFI